MQELFLSPIRRCLHCNHDPERLRSSDVTCLHRTHTGTKNPRKERLNRKID